MQSSELVEIIEKFPSISKTFLGVFSINTVPKLSKKHQFVILNTEESFKPGKHWFCVIKTYSKEFELFDSLGINVEKLDRLRDFNILPSNSVLKYNENAVQNSDSITCGLFVCYFLIQRLHNFDMSFSDLINEIFTLNKDLNETTVLNFCKSHFI